MLCRLLVVPPGASRLVYLRLAKVQWRSGFELTNAGKSQHVDLLQYHVYLDKNEWPIVARMAA